MNKRYKRKEEKKSIFHIDQTQLQQSDVIIIMKHIIE